MPGFKEDGGGGLFNFFKQRRKDKSIKSVKSGKSKLPPKSAGKSASNIKTGGKRSVAGSMLKAKSTMKSSKGKDMTIFKIFFITSFFCSDALKEQYAKQVQVCLQSQWSGN